MRFFATKVFDTGAFIFVRCGGTKMQQAGIWSTFMDDELEDAFRVSIRVCTN
jgi:hypothetical protein